MEYDKFYCFYCFYCFDVSEIFNAYFISNSTRKFSKAEKRIRRSSSKLKDMKNMFPVIHSSVLSSAAVRFCYFLLFYCKTKKAVKTYLPSSAVMSLSSPQQCLGIQDLFASIYFFIVLWLLAGPFGLFIFYR